MSSLPAGEAAELVREVAAGSESRLALWSAFLERLGARRVAELGVYRGAFAEHVLAARPEIEAYHMIDPWRHLDDWNKPANRDDGAFERIYEEAMRRTEAHAGRRRVLRGRTVDVIDEIPDGSLDFAYVDGDHTLRGITVDLIRVWPKLRDGGWLGGDDLAPSIWQHGDDFEPTLVFPFAIHFAEAVGCPVHALPHRQFLIHKAPGEGFRFDDLTGRYPHLELLRQATARRPPRAAAAGRPRPARRAAAALRALRLRLVRR